MIMGGMRINKLKPILQAFLGHNFKVWLPRQNFILKWFLNFVLNEMLPWEWNLESKLVLKLKFNYAKLEVLLLGSDLGLGDYMKDGVIFPLTSQVRSLRMLLDLLLFTGSTTSITCGQVKGAYPSTSCSRGGANKEGDGWPRMPGGPGGGKHTSGGKDTPCPGFSLSCHWDVGRTGSNAGVPQSPVGQVTLLSIWAEAD